MRKYQWIKRLPEISMSMLGRVWVIFAVTPSGRSQRWANLMRVLLLADEDG